MKNLFLAVTLLFSMNAMAIDMSQDQVKDPTADAAQNTAALAARGAVSITPVICKILGTAKSPVLNCTTTRSVVYPEYDLVQENSSWWFEYELNADGVTFTRTNWEPSL